MARFASSEGPYGFSLLFSLARTFSFSLSFSCAGEADVCSIHAALAPARPNVSPAATAPVFSKSLRRVIDADIWTSWNQRRKIAGANNSFTNERAADIEPRHNENGQRLR